MGPSEKETEEAQVFCMHPTAKETGHLASTPSSPLVPHPIGSWLSIWKAHYNGKGTEL